MRARIKVASVLSVFAVALSGATVLHAQPAAPAAKSYKFQSTWPGSLTLQDNFRYFTERVDKLTSGQVATAWPTTG